MTATYLTTSLNILLNNPWHVVTNRILYSHVDTTCCIYLYTGGSYERDPNIQQKIEALVYCDRRLRSWHRVHSERSSPTLFPFKLWVYQGKRAVEVFHGRVVSRYITQTGDFYHALYALDLWKTWHRDVLHRENAWMVLHSHYWRNVEWRNQSFYCSIVRMTVAPSRLSGCYLQW